VELNLTNILDFQLDETSLDQIIKWYENDHKEIKAMYTQTGLVRLQQAMQDQENEEVDAADRASHILMNHWNINPEKFEIVLDLIEFISEADLQAHEDPAHFLKLHKTRGNGINIADALIHLHDYVGENHRFSDDISDLYLATNAIVTEIERKVTNGLID
jgi:uncharacterized tellurite resistance protein B-like protein